MKKYGIFILVAMVLIAMVASFEDVGAAGPLDDNSLMKFRFGVTSTPRELNYSDGVTSAIQTQLDAIAAGTSLGTGSVDSDNILNSTIVSVDILDNSVASADILNSTIQSIDILDNSVASADILNSTIASIDILDNSVASADILNSTIASVDILDNSVASADITNGTIDPVDLTAKSWQIMVAGSLASLAGSATNTVTNNNINNGQLLFASVATTDDTDFINTVANSDHSVMTIVSSADPSTAHSYDYVGINNNPSIGDVPWQVIGAFNATSAGGDATETVAVAGSLTTDIVIVELENDGANDVTVAAARVSSDGTVTITLSADPATAAVMAGIVVRPNSTDDAESHSIVYAGSTTTGGGAAVEAITVTGMLTTDIVIAVQDTFVDQTLEYAVGIANTINATFDGDPGADEVITWMVLRAN